MQNLKTRLSELEKCHTTAKINLIVRFDCPSQTGAELWCLEHYSDEYPRQVWERRPNETEKEFTDRAISEVKRNSYGAALFIQKDLENHHANTY